MSGSGCSFPSCAYEHLPDLESPQRCRRARARAHLDIDVWRPYAEFLQLWSQASQKDASCPHACSRTSNDEKRRDPRRDLTSSPLSSPLPACRAQIVPPAEVNHPASLTSSPAIPGHLATHPTADLPALRQSSSSPCRRPHAPLAPCPWALAVVLLSKGLPLCLAT